MIDKSYCRLAFEDNTRRLSAEHGMDIEKELRTKANGDFADPRVYAAWCGWQDCWEFCSTNLSKGGN